MALVAGWDRFLGAAGLLVAAAACGGDELSLGETPAEPARLEEVARLGCGVCGGPEQLAVAYVAIEGSGQTYLIDRFEPFIRVFNTEGRLRSSFGIAGEGPGEMGTRLPGVPLEPPIGLYFTREGEAGPDDGGGDGLLIHDLMPARLARFDRDGEYIETIRLDGALTFPAGRAFDAANNHVYLATYQLRMFSENPGSSIHRFDLPNGEESNVLSGEDFPIGQKKNVLVHKFVCKGTVEERIDALIAGKQRLSDQVLAGGAESKLTEMSNDELLALVSLDMQSAVEA